MKPSLLQMQPPENLKLLKGSHPGTAVRADQRPCPRPGCDRQQGHQHGGSPPAAQDGLRGASARRAGAVPRRSGRAARTDPPPMGVSSGGGRHAATAALRVKPARIGAGCWLFSGAATAVSSGLAPLAASQAFTATAAPAAPAWACRSGERPRTRRTTGHSARNPAGSSRRWWLLSLDHGRAPGCKRACAVRRRLRRGGEPAPRAAPGACARVALSAGIFRRGREIFVPRETAAEPPDRRSLQGERAAGLRHERRRGAGTPRRPRPARRRTLGRFRRGSGSTTTYGRSERSCRRVPTPARCGGRCSSRSPVPWSRSFPSNRPLPA